MIGTAPGKNHARDDGECHFGDGKVGSIFGKMFEGGDDGVKGFLVFYASEQASEHGKGNIP